MKKTTYRSAVQLLAAGTAVVALAACNTESGAGTGSMTLQITDAAVDSAESVNVRFTGVTLKHENASPHRIDFEEARTIDLLSLQGDTFDTLLDGETVTAGRYEWIRLHVEAARNTIDSYIVLDGGAEHSLFVPSGAQTGLQLVSGFDVPVNGSGSFTIDFDLRKSVINPQSDDDYFLKPTLRLVDNSTIGHIDGVVRPDDFAACNDNEYAVYVFEGADAEPVDININRDDDEPNPLTSAQVAFDEDEYQYTVGFLSAGDYTLSFTCEAGSDDPEADDDLTFVAEQNVTVTAGERTQADFAASAD